jgi:hypothetical protein
VLWLRRMVVRLSDDDLLAIWLPAAIVDGQLLRWPRFSRNSSLVNFDQSWRPNKLILTMEDLSLCARIFPHSSR